MLCSRQQQRKFFTLHYLNATKILVDSPHTCMKLLSRHINFCRHHRCHTSPQDLNADWLSRLELFIEIQIYQLSQISMWHEITRRLIRATYFANFSVQRAAWQGFESNRIFTLTLHVIKSRNVLFAPGANTTLDRNTRQQGFLLTAKQMHIHSSGSRYTVLTVLTWKIC